MAKDTRIKDVEMKYSGIGENSDLVLNTARGAIPKNREVIEEYVVEPCVEACKHLYDLNIKTVNSGIYLSDKNDISSKGYIGIDYNLLSDKNKAIANAMSEVGLIERINYDLRSPLVVISVLLNSNSSVDEVSNRLMTLSNFFCEQDVLYGRTTKKEVEKCFKYIRNGTYYDSFKTLGEITEEEKEKILNEYLNTRFLSEDGYYYISEDLRNKHEDYIKSQAKESQKQV